MATITTGGGGGLFGTLGGLATIGGALTGQPWLSALGTGLGMMNGQGGAGQQGGTGSSLADMLSGLFSNALGGGSISGKNTQQQQPQKRYLLPNFLQSLLHSCKYNHLHWIQPKQSNSRI